MARHASVQEADNGYVCNMTEDHEYPGETQIAKNMDEVHEHLKKHFSGKPKPKKVETKTALSKLARH